MTTQTTGWKSAFTAFLDRRALIMLFLGFSAGVPILLIFSSLSLWLGEAGVEKSAVTFFSWAALGYSFKFVWAPLIDELPVPLLTKALGHRRAWLLVAQCLIIVAICVMAFSDPSLGSSYLTQMALGAVLLGFAGATQDIVIDAYRIELAETQMQTVLASTYNAGYRIGMIVAGAGALFLAAYLGTAKGNYIYDAWKYTYLTMAGVMGVGILTTLMIREPVVNRVKKHYQRSDYARLVMVFFTALLSLIFAYIFIGNMTDSLKASYEIKSPVGLFGLEALCFMGAFSVAIAVGCTLVKFGAVHKKMAMETWVAPIADFFQRYGVKVALALLLMIGFYRISDIIAGVISNVFYQDLNFSKEQIAEAVKVYGVIFSLVGGFLGGLLAQRMNIMKLMFVGAILASATNLIFVGLVKSGQPLQEVQVQIGSTQHQVKADEVGLWEIRVPTTELMQNHQITVQNQYQDGAEKVQVSMPYLTESDQNRLHILPVTRNNDIDLQEQEKSIVVRGQYFGAELAPNEKLIFQVGTEKFDAKLDKEGIFSSAIPAKVLKDDATHLVHAFLMQNDQVKMQTEHTYTTSQQASNTQHLDLEVTPLTQINPKNAMTEIKGKVIQSYSAKWLYFAIIVDNLASGLAGAAFIAFLSSLTSVSFTAVQYALFSSLMTMTPKLLGGYSGTIVENIGYPNFFMMTTLIGIPILILVVWVGRLLKTHQQALDEQNMIEQQKGE